jgi:hypothetical protein
MNQPGPDIETWEEWQRLHGAHHTGSCYPSDTNCILEIIVCFDCEGASFVKNEVFL